MEQHSPQPMDQDADIARFSDEDVSRLFESCGDPELVSNILHIKRNDPTVNILYTWGANLNDAASSRLGVFIGQSTHLEELCLTRVDVEALCVGLQRNKSIRKFQLQLIDLQTAEKMISLAPFLTQNPSLKIISLQQCRLGQASIDILANVLSNGAANILESINLSGNPVGDIDLHGFIEALSVRRCLRKLDFSYCGIGRRACAALATLLENSDSNLAELYLDGNSTDNQSTITLARSLVNNQNLQILYLRGNEQITAEGLRSVLQLVFNSLSIENLINSNHVLNDIMGSEEEFVNHLDDGDGNLLCASLELNRGDNKLLIARRKIIWSHARGDLNMGQASIAVGAMPRILAWFGNDSDQPDAEIVQYHDPPLQEPEVDESDTESIEYDTESSESDTESIQGPDIGIVSLGGVFRILRAMPDLCNRERDKNT